MPGPGYRPVTAEPSKLLPKEEYIEQAYFFRTLGERMLQDITSQDVLGAIKEGILATTKLPMAIDFLSAELRSTGVFSPAMERLSHYFTPFQTFVVAEAEEEKGYFELRMGLEVLFREAEYRAAGATPQGIFLYQFESLCRNRLSYDRGLAAMAQDPIFDKDWRQWIMEVRRDIGLVDTAEMIYSRSETRVLREARQGLSVTPTAGQVLFGDKEGRIALATRRKDPLMLFASLHRQLGYPAVPRPAPIDQSHEAFPQLVRRVQRLETRIKLLEAEQKGGIDLEHLIRPEGPEGVGPQQPE